MILALSFVANITAFSRQSNAGDVNGNVVLEMSGELAAEYTKLTNPAKRDSIPNGLRITTTGSIAQRLENGRLRIEHSIPVWDNGVQTRLVTLTAVVDASAVKSTVIPKGTQTFSSPGASKAGEKGVETKTDSEQSTLELNDLKRVKLRTWKLENEIGE
jgi:hypothetical protein